MASNMTTLGTRLSIAYLTIKRLTAELDRIEVDTQTPAIQRLSQIKKIREELDKVGEEIDIIKKEITLLNSYRVN